MAQPKHKMFRIESTYGLGMYRASRAAWSMHDQNHPGPWEDSLLAHGMRGVEHFAMDKYHFGFASESQLRNWIYDDEWLRSLHNEGLVLTIMEVDEYIIGHTQAIFIKTENYTQHNIMEYFNLTGENQ